VYKAIIKAPSVASRRHMRHLLVRIVAGLAFGLNPASAAPLPKLDGLVSQTNAVEDVGYRYHRGWRPYRYGYWGYRRPYYGYGYYYRPYYYRPYYRPYWRYWW
jgi:hypothetical protein